MSTRFALFLFLMFVVAATYAPAQVDDFCSEAGIITSFDSPFAHVPYVYGRIVVKGVPAGEKFPRVSIEMEEAGQSPEKLLISKTGNYCFKRRSGGGNLIVTLNGVEAARRTLPAGGASQDREDFEISAEQRSVPPSTISAKFPYVRSEKTLELYNSAVVAAHSKKPEEAMRLLSQIVAADPKDFTAWSELGDQYFVLNKFAEANDAYRHALELRIDYTPAWINIGELRVVQKQIPAAIEIFKHVIELEPSGAKAFRLLGEAYLQNKEGTLGAEALHKAIELDPLGMAECHLALAHLYELAGAKPMATREYKAFLGKVPDYPERKRLEKFIKDNPE